MAANCARKNGTFDFLVEKMGRYFVGLYYAYIIIISLKFYLFTKCQKDFNTYVESPTLAGP